MTPSIVRIRDHWPWVYPALQELIDSTGAGIMPEDVFHWCESGKAVFVLAHEGFVVAAAEVDPVTGAKELLIWFAHANQIGTDCVAQYMPYFMDLAKELGCRYITTKTVFEPVGHHLEERGWKRGPTEYKLAVR